MDACRTRMLLLVKVVVGQGSKIGHQVLLPFVIARFIYIGRIDRIPAGDSQLLFDGDVRVSAIAGLSSASTACHLFLELPPYNGKDK